MNKVKTKNRSAEIEALIREMTLEEKAALWAATGIGIRTPSNGWDWIER